jgi:Holliday junction resolvase RusA-like endonuclease
VTVVAFRVLGTPSGQGSKSAVVRGGRAVVIEGRSSNQRALHTNWRSAVAAAAAEARLALPEPLSGPLYVTARFRHQMPAGRPRALRAHGLGWKATAPDLDKLARALGDGLTAGGLIVDDRLIVEWSISKVETVDWTGAEIHIETIQALP